MSITAKPPQTEAELLERARALAGWTLGELGRRVGVDVPASAARAKGLAGTLIETILGATAASRAEPDFQEIGVELKTIPVDTTGRPRESTFVASISLSAMADTDWEQSVVWKKLRRVLFVPIEWGDKPLHERRIGLAGYWSPNDAELAMLRRDWELLAQMIAAGETEQITGHLGQVLQVRPKAAHGRSRRRAPDQEGAVQWTMPRGFYLRPAFTAQLIARLHGADERVQTGPDVLRSEPHA